MNVALRKPMSRDEFLHWAEAQEGRYEFDGVQPVAMVGGTNGHGVIASNLNGQLYLRLRGKTCRPMGAEGGGVATIGGKIRYPDALVTCSKVDRLDRLTPDPVIVFEVISPHSEREDRILKPAEYHAVSSIKRYVLVEQDFVGLTVYWRQHDEPWSALTLADGHTLALPEIGIEIPVNDLYEGIAFDAAPN
jgi:Uma2 family endonuclease